MHNILLTIPIYIYLAVIGVISILLIHYFHKSRLPYKPPPELTLKIQTLEKENSALITELNKHKEWNEIKSKYNIAHLDTNTTVVISEKTDDDSIYCKHCYDNLDKLSTLQPEKIINYIEYFFCPECKNSYPCRKVNAEIKFTPIGPKRMFFRDKPIFRK